jgi:hypothetical protein
LKNEPASKELMWCSSEINVVSRRHQGCFSLSLHSTYQPCAGSPSLRREILRVVGCAHRAPACRPRSLGPRCTSSLLRAFYVCTVLLINSEMPLVFTMSTRICLPILQTRPKRPSGELTSTVPSSPLSCNLLPKYIFFGVHHTHYNYGLSGLNDTMLNQKKC